MLWDASVIPTRTKYTLLIDASVRIRYWESLTPFNLISRRTKNQLPLNNSYFSALKETNNFTFTAKPERNWK